MTIFEQSKTKTIGEWVGFIFGALLFFFMINLLSWLGARSFGRGLVLSLIILTLLGIAEAINSRHKKWIW